LEPFLEFNYLPSQYVHTGVRAALPLSDQLAVIAVLGYASGDTGSNFNYNNQNTGSNLEFSRVYLGFGASFLDKIFGKGDLRYGKGYPHE